MYVYRLVFRLMRPPLRAVNKSATHVLPNSFTKLGPPPFLPSDAAAIRGVKTLRRSRQRLAVGDEHTRARDGMSARHRLRSQRTARIAMADAPGVLSLILLGWPQMSSVQIRSV